MFVDTVVVVQAEQVRVDGGKLLEGEEPPKFGGAAALLQLSKQPFLREGGGPELHAVLLQDLVDVAALELWEQRLLHHHHGDENRPCPNHMGEGAVLGVNVDLQLGQDTAEG